MFTKSPQHRIGGVVLDQNRRCLWRDGEEIRIRAKSFDVLAHLAAARGALVTKEALIAAVWGDTAVTDDSLVQCFVEIRRCLGPDQHLVKTVRGRGYLLEDDPSIGRVENRVAVNAPPPEPTWASERLRRRGLLAATTIFAVVAVAGFADHLVRGERSNRTRVVGEESRIVEARALFDEAQLAFERRTWVDLQYARDALMRAIALDPEFARAHAALANTHILLSVLALERPLDALRTARAAADRALALDATLSEALVASGHTEVHLGRNWTKAEQQYRRAIALDPSNAFAHQLLAHLLIGLGRSTEGLRASEVAVRLAPDVARRGSRALLQYLVRDHDGSAETFAAVTHEAPSYPLARFWNALNHLALGDPHAAMTEALASRQQVGMPPTWLIGYVHARAGRRDDAVDVLNALSEHARGSYVPATEFAFLHVGLGDHDRALEWLARGIDEHSHWMELIAVHPVLDPLRDDPRFRRLLERLNLPVLTF